MVKIKVVDFKKDDSYTGLMRFRCFIDDDYKACGKTETEALLNALERVYSVNIHLKKELEVLKEAVKPIIALYNEKNDD